MSHEGRVPLFFEQTKEDVADILFVVYDEDSISGAGHVFLPLGSVLGPRALCANLLGGAFGEGVSPGPCPQSEPLFGQPPPPQSAVVRLRPPMCRGPSRSPWCNRCETGDSSASRVNRPRTSPLHSYIPVFLKPSARQ